MSPKRVEEKPKGEGSSLLPVISGLLGAAAVLQVFLFLVYAYRSITFPYQLDYGEGPILQIAQHVALGGPMYPPVDEPPYLIASYVPLYYALCALGVKLTGVNFVFGRLLSCVGAVAIAVFAALVVWHHTRQRFAAFVSGAMILAMPHFMVWGTIMRVDILALAFAVAGFYFFTVKHRFVGMSLFALATLTRRTTVGAMAAALVSRAREDGLVKALRSFGLQVAIIAVLFGTAVLLTGGGLYHQLHLHTATSVGKSWSWQQLWSLLWVSENPSPLKLWPVYFAITGIAAVWNACHRPTRSLFVYFIIACAIFLTGGRVGSAHNYLLEPTVVGAMMFGVMWGVVSPKAGGRRIGLMLMAGALAAQMVWMLIPPHLTDTLSILRPRVHSSSSRIVIERIQLTDGPVLCEDTGLTLLAGEKPPLMPFEFTMMARAGALDPEPVFQGVREGRYPLIVLRFNPFNPRDQALHRAGSDWKGGRWPEGIISGVVARYRLEEEVGPYFLFVPK
ncbi:MAG: phospholipid carrier-dependent glycosyltransferase [Thermoleophilia bacterium]|nr:phospholipid carrier-dependent glycosyltransferase [Thermoleophilia bacterium]